MASCSDDTDPACTPQETRYCAGVGRCEGVEACLADGSGWGACDCSGAPREGAGGTSGEGEPVTPFVGRACTEDAECGAGLTCFTSTSDNFLGGGPSNGYCSANCAADADCSGIDSQSECVVPAAGAAGLCLRTCLSQDPTSVAENKCLGRYDVACESVAYLGQEDFSGLRQPGWCYPQCASNDDCGTRRCDLARGLCVDTPRPVELKPLGARCEADTECEGRLCIGLASGETFCSAPCVFGQPIGCGYGKSASPRGAGCLRPLQTGFLSSEGIGDVGLCAQLCSDSSQCTQADRGWECDLTVDAQDRFNTPGVCDAQAPTDAGADAATDASAPPIPPPPTGDAGG
jgi:hypothetical protein